MDTMKRKIPALRFPEFDGEWQQKRIGKITNRISDPVIVQDEKLYQQIGIRSHGKGIFYKELVTGKSLGNKRVFWVKKDMFVVNIVFAWEQAIAKTTIKEIGMIASHRFPMYQPAAGVLYLDFICHFFLTLKGKHLLELASPGGAGRNKTLGQKEFERLMVNLPVYNEQQKIADFLTTVDEKINQLTRKKTLLEQYKKGVMQKIFSQEIRFKDDDGKEFPPWEVKQLIEFVEPIKRKSFKTNDNVLTISAGKGFLKQKERFNQVIAGSSLEKYTLLKKDEFSYNRGNSKSYTYGCIYKLTEYESAIVPNVYRSFRLLEGVPDFLEQLFINKYLDKQLRQLISSSARMDGLLNIGEKEFYKCKVIFPCIVEQKKIADFLTGIDKKIERVNSQLEKTKIWKKGLLQQMFV